MNKRFWCSFLPVATFVLSAAGLGAVAAESITNQVDTSLQVDQIIAAFPVDSGAKAEEQYRKILAGGKGMVEVLCSRVKPAAAGGNDARVRFAVHGLAHCVARPGTEDQRHVVATVLAEGLGSAATDDVRDFFAEQLRFVADNSSISPVARLLLDARTVNRAAAIMITLGTRPAEGALLDALCKADPRCESAIIQALGDMGSKNCVKQCASRLDSTNALIRSEALRAIVRSGTAKAGEILAARRRGPSTELPYERILEASIGYAERLMELGEARRAAALARSILNDKASGNDLRCRALAVLGSTRHSAILPAVIACLSSTNRVVRGQAAAQVAGLRGRNVTSTLAAAAQSAAGDVLATYLDILSSRPDFTGVAIFERALASENIAVRAAGLEGLCRMNSAGSAKVLLAALEKADQQDGPAIAAAVKGLSAREALATVAEGLGSVLPTVRVVAVRTLAAHRCCGHTAAILKLTRDPEAPVAREAFKALAVLVDEAGMSDVIEAGLACKDEPYRNSIAATVASTAPRLAGRSTFTGKLVSAYKDADADCRMWILSLLPAFGGPAALETATAASLAAEPKIREAGTRALAAWPDDTALPALFAVLESGTNDNAHSLALAGVVKLLGESGVPQDRRLEMCAKALKAASSEREVWQILSVVSEVHTTGAIELVIPLLDREDVKNETALAIARIACPKTGAGPVLPPNQLTALQKACGLVSDKALKEKLAARLAATAK